MQRIDLNARIVRDGRQTTMSRRVAALEDGVFDEGQAGLFRLRNAELTLGDDLDLLACQERIDFPDLTGVVAGENDGLASARCDHDPACNLEFRTWLDA